MNYTLVRYMYVTSVIYRQIEKKNVDNIINNKCISRLLSTKNPLHYIYLSTCISCDEEFEEFQSNLVQ